MVHTANIVVRILRRMTTRKLSLYLEKVSLDLEEEKEIYLVQEFCTYVMDWQKLVDRANWAILTQILKGTEIDDAKEIYQQNMHESVLK
jgi:hypothetical protein